MKINKLLFFLLALVSLNSCVEYVNNGTMPDGPEKPEEQKFTAEHSNPEEAKYVGDKFEFTAMLNSVDVTATTKFKVNGTNIPGNSYTPVKTGSHSVIATMDNFTATFKFTVLEEEEPEPEGNRIEYGGDSYPVSITEWYVNLNANNQIQGYNINGTVCTLWAMMSVELDANDEIVNSFFTFTLVPTINSTTPAFPNESPSALIDAEIGGSVTINGADVFDITASTYTFASSGNTAPANWSTQQPPWNGTAKFTALATGANSGNSAELFWEGSCVGNVEKFAKPAKKNAVNAVEFKNMKNVTMKQLQQIKELDKYKVQGFKFA